MAVIETIVTKKVTAAAEAAVIILAAVGVDNTEAVEAAIITITITGVSVAAAEARVPDVPGVPDHVQGIHTY